MDKTEPAPAPAPPLVSALPAFPIFGTALRFWLLLGFISFGGPAGQIALMHRELVERRRWISEGRFLHALNYCMLLPGPEAQQLAIYMGWLLHGTRGGLAAGALFVLPSLLILVALSWLYMAYGQTPLMAGALWGIKPAVTAIVLLAAWRIGKRVLRNAALFAIALAAFVAIYGLQLPFPAIVLAAALLGLAGARWAPAWFTAAGGHGPRSNRGRSADVGTPHAGRALIDDGTPTPPHARFSRRVLMRTVAVAAGLWMVGMAVLWAQFGWQGTLTQMGWFFTKAALLTFGGAYAVLPYVAQAGVAQFGWLTAPQMIDGLALGETTPGPLIMVVAFVAFVGAWTQQALGPGHVLAAGVLAACVATFFTFLPSFLFILAGGPLVEATHGDLKFTAPLLAITAAVVGVVLNLALFFAAHVLWPQGAGGVLDAWALAVGCLAGVALWRWQTSVPLVILGCALLGLARVALV